MIFDKNAGSYIYLEEHEVIEINRRQMAEEGKKSILKEPGELSIILESPYLISFGVELYPTLWEKAACYLYKLTVAHVFENANKRTAFLAAYIFMRANGYIITAERDVLYDFMLALADSINPAGYEEAVAFIRRESVPVN
ncbi:type II toxin-antitoxin system death-on-curing family toxin [Alkalicoccus halolimnae]|uniref:Type II toxin-antitoxin system death-on-curing family toxin n=1 Tax=Alkalicoccus halolimnae TaxID=1667239 RepID=A0A5C7F7E1_9BACI|nr:type II toxin-antitoxin system death-on-curing family toxin [Alkalicoccus halolimnae]TXF85490.1 type II toxin-antitoxin system death-on-curing family toxin [Alkalicoccus halolimnae]